MTQVAFIMRYKNISVINAIDMCDLNIPQNNADRIHVVLMPSIFRVHIFYHSQVCKLPEVKFLICCVYSFISRVGVRSNI